MDHIIKQADDVADNVVRKMKPILKPLARVCMLSTFVEDGIRMFTQWGDQSSYIASTWNCGVFLASMFVFINLVGQLVPVAMIMLRKRVDICVLVLGAVIFLQSIAYYALWDFHFFLKNLAVLGGLLLLWAESMDSGKDMFAGVPQLDAAKPNNMLQLAGRVMIVLLYVTLVKFNSVWRNIFDIFGLFLVCMVTVGFKTKLSALALVCLLLIENLTLNRFWSLPSHSHTRDFVKYDFFQTLSCIGGMLLVVALGAGGLSIDEHKKAW